MTIDAQPQNQTPRSSRVGRVMRFLVFRFFPVLLIIAIFWSGYRVIEAFADQSRQYSELQSRVPAYVETATALAPTEDSEASAGSVLVARRQGRHDVRQVFSTNTPQPDAVIATVTPQVPVPTVASEGIAQPTAPVLPTLLLPPDPGSNVAAPTAIPTRVPVIPRENTLVNILLLGTDDEVANDNVLRTDSMIIVSINVDTGTVSMLSLPRDLYVYIPSGLMQRLNVAYGIGENIGWTDGGWGLLRQTIFYNLGINVHYYARVNFSGFETIIDTLGGVDLAVDCAYQDYYPVEDFDPSRTIDENYELRTLPVGYYTMNGFDALWYARTRKVSDDFDRGRRQQQILRAILRKARDSGDLANLASLWGPLTEVVETNLTFADVAGLLPLALSIDSSSIENYTLIRTYHTTPWQTPDGDYVQLPEYEPIHQLLTDFYTPPSTSQLALYGPRIGVYNGTENADWDRVAAERLGWEGFNAVALGAAPENSADTTLVDLTGESKGSLVGAVASILNIRSENVSQAPDANREYDYVIVLGENYNSCTYSVLPVDG